MSSAEQPVPEPVANEELETAAKPSAIDSPGLLPATSTNTGAPQQARRSRLRRAFGWLGGALWLGGEVRDARAAIAAPAPSQRNLLQHARATAESADRVFDPIDPLRSGSGISVAAAQYAEAVRCALAVTLGGGGTRDLSELGSGELRDHIVAAARSELGFERAAALAAPNAIAELLASGALVTREDAALLRTICHALLERALAPERRLHRLLMQRLLRITAALILLAVIVSLPIVAVSVALARPDLSLGKIWRASSSYAGFSPAKGECDGRKTGIFFHTNEEENPWIEYDLAQPTTIERVRIVNRTDCCPDRAIPLVVEVSADGDNWVEVARRSDAFGRWSPKFSPTTTRYVRLRALKRTWLHFENVSIH